MIVQRHTRKANQNTRNVRVGAAHPADASDTTLSATSQETQRIEGKERKNRPTE
jgi:hypothetical protein